MSGVKKKTEMVSDLDADELLLYIITFEQTWCKHNHKRFKKVSYQAKEMDQSIFPALSL